MVAASGSMEGLKPWVAWACLAFVILGISAAVLLGRQVFLFRRMPLEKPPEVLAERAREILRKAGYPEAPVDSAFGFAANEDYFQYVRNHDRSASRWDRLPDSALPFWYRQSPRLLATVAGILFSALFFSFPITTQLSAWYSGIGLAGLLLLLGLTPYAFHTSLGGQPLFGRAALED